MTTPCFWLEPTEQVEIRLRRFTHSDGKDHYHSAVSKPVAIEERTEENSLIRYSEDPAEAPWDFTDERWPTECEECGYEFAPTDPWQVFPHLLFERPDTGEVITLREAPPGAMWDAHWMPSSTKGHDGMHLMVVLPNGNHWSVDGQASNCTRPGEDHDCWCRHGEVPNITVDKNPEPGRTTCAAGAGSIGSGDYHGFLRNGVLT